MQQQAPISTAQIHKVFTTRVSLGVLFASLFYFVDILWRSARKPFWFDELFTVYLVRLPTMRDTWTAVQHGADFNPPLFYLLTRMSQAAFGPGNIALRLPETIGVWVFCVCLFAFVARRLGPLAGCIAGLFPFFTLAQYYAYEARPHGITVGWCGLALVCWQRIMEGKAKLAWHIGFTLAMLCGVLTHVYAVYIFVPFALVEALTLVRERKLHPGIVVGLAIPTLIAVPLFVPMMRSYKVLTLPAQLAWSNLDEILVDYARQTLGASILPLIFFVALAAFALASRSRRAGAEESPDTHGTRMELVLAVCFICLPLVGISLGRLDHVGFFSRYCLSAIAGIAILFAHAVSRVSMSALPSKLMASFLCLMFLADSGELAVNSMANKVDTLIEPSSNQVLYRNPAEEMSDDVAAFNRVPDLPILNVNELNYLYMYHYAPQSIVNRLYYTSAYPEDFFYVSYQRLAQWAQVPLQLTRLEPFLDRYDHFYVYCNKGIGLTGCGLVSLTLSKANYALISESLSPDGTISEYRKTK